MSTPREKHVPTPGKAPEDIRRAILARARPLPDIPAEDRIRLSDEEARVFYDAITNA